VSRRLHRRLFNVNDAFYLVISATFARDSVGWPDPTTFRVILDASIGDQQGISQSKGNSRIA
jgi:hypothetical protein